MTLSFIKGDPTSWSAEFPDFCETPYPDLPAPDQSTFNEYLRLLGITSGESFHLRLLAGKGEKGAKTLKCIGPRPVKNPQTGQWSDGDFRAHGRNLTYHAPLAYFDDLHAAQQSGMYPGLVVNPGGNAARDIEFARAIYFECDELPKEDQWGITEKYGLPAPTFVVETRKSLHQYYVLTDLIPIEEWLKLQHSLVALIEESDNVIKDPSRVLRCPGFFHLQDGLEPFFCGLVKLSGARYNPDDLWAHIPEAKQVTKVVRAGRKSKTASGNVTPEDILAVMGQFPDWFHKFTQEEQEKFLSETVRTPMAPENNPPGGRNGRLNDAGFRLGLNLGRLVDFSKKNPTPEDSLKLAIRELSDAAELAWANEPGSAAFEMVQTGFRAIYDGFLLSTEKHPYAIQDRLLGKYDGKPTGEEIDQQFLEPAVYEQQERVVLVQATQGKGKTSSQGVAIAKFKEQNPTTKILYIGHRQTLIHQTAKLLKLTNYQNCQGTAQLNESQYLAICLDSLWKLDPGQWEGALVVLDEIDQLLQHHHASTSIKDKRREVLHKWYRLVGNATQVWGMSADIPVLVEQHLRGVLGSNVEIKRIRNINKGAYRKWVESTSSVAMESELISRLEKGLNEYVACNSRRKATELYEEMRARFPEMSIVLITSETKEVDPAAKKFLHAPLNNLPQLLIASPTLGTGFDINVPDFYHSTFLFMGAQDTASAWDIIQHAFRVRQLISGEIYFYCPHRCGRGLILSEAGFYSAIWEDEDTLKSMYSTGIDRVPQAISGLLDESMVFRRLVKPHPDGGYTVSNDPLEAQYLRDFVGHNLRRNASLLCLNRHLKKLISERGDDLGECVPTPDKTRGDKIEKPEALGTFDAFLDAEPFETVVEMEATACLAKAKGTMTIELQQRIQKTKFLSLTGMTDSELQQRVDGSEALKAIVTDFIEYRLYHQISLWASGFFYSKDYTLWLDSLEVFDAKMMASDRKKRTAKGELLRTIIPLWVLEGQIIRESEKGELATLLKANKAKTKKLLGVAVSGDEKGVIKEVNKILALMGVSIVKSGKSKGDARYQFSDLSKDRLDLYREFHTRNNRGQLSLVSIEEGQKKIWNSKQAELLERLADSMSDKEAA